MRKSLLSITLFGLSLVMVNLGFAKDFSFSDVEQKAKSLAGHNYEAQKNDDLPQDLANLDYIHYSQILPKADKDVWADEKLPFRLAFFQRGYIYKDRVNVNIIDKGEASPVMYSPDRFDFGPNKFAEPLSSNLGFAGFRIKYVFPHAENPKDPAYEVAVFLGASYFRAVTSNHVFGLSARALAINTGLPEPEEFPVFREFWVEKPSSGAKTLTFYGLLDSPSVTGAYRFVLHPGDELTLDVQSHLYFRHAVKRFGVAPITSMFYYGKNTERHIDDFRPEVHDSDGLLVKKSSNEWLWRPLINPLQLGLSILKESSLSGFGLFQRERNESQYQDLNYNLRPNLWVEPIGHWKSGAVYLIEIPSDAEIYDNIAAFWVPDAQTGPGKEFSFNYRLHFLFTELAENNLAKVISTRVGAGGLNGNTSALRRFAVTFKIPDMQHVPAANAIVPVINTSQGKLQRINVFQDPDKKVWRLVFDLDPQGNVGPIELRAYLAMGKKTLSETWLYQWRRV
jgi:glucans biosynthesis protein